MNVNLSDPKRVFLTAALLFLSGFVIRWTLWWKNATGLTAWVRTGGGGFKTTPDSSWYINNCETIIIDPLEAIVGSGGLQYLGFRIPFCAVYTTTESLPVWVFFQVLLSALTCVLLYLAGRQLFSPAAGVIAGGLFVILYDSFRYSIIILTETTFLFVLGLVTWTFARYLDDRTPRRRFSLYLALLLVAISRPHGIPFIIGWVLWDLLPEGSLMRPDLTTSRSIVLGAIIGIVGVITTLTHIPQYIQTQAVPNMSSEHVFWSGNQPMPIPEFPFVITSSDSLFLFFSHNGPQISLLALYRTLILYWPVMPHLLESPGWLAIHLGSYLPLVGFGMLGLVTLFRERNPAFSILVVPVVISTCIVAFGHLDYSWRLRLPLEPTLAVAAGYGATRVSILHALLAWASQKIPIIGKEFQIESHG